MEGQYGSRISRGKGVVTAGGGWHFRSPIAFVAVIFVPVTMTLQWPPNISALGESTQIRGLRELCSAKDATCVGFVPWHPIFCRDAAGLYWWTDVLNATRDDCSELYRRNHRQLWPPAIAAIEKGIPEVVVDNGLWRDAYQAGVIDDDQYKRYERAVHTLYETAHVGEWLVYTLKKDHVRNR